MAGLQEAIGQVLHPLHAGAVGMGGAEGLHSRAAIESRRPLGEPALAGELARELTQRPASKLATLAYAAEQRIELRSIEPKLRRRRAPVRDELLEVDVLLRGTGLERGLLARGAPNAIRRLMIAAQRLEKCASTGAAIPASSAIPLRTGPHSTPRYSA